MARLSKHSFAIYEDSGIPTPDSTLPDPFDDVPEEDEDEIADEDIGGATDQYEEDAEEEVHEDGTKAVDEDRRESALTRTSISSLGNTTCEEEPTYTPPIIRPSFMRPESVRRMQMSSPPPYRSPRQSVLRHSRPSRHGTPHSVRSAQARGSPMSRKRYGSHATDAEENKIEYPLVLLHITLLPIMLPWSAEAIQEILPERTMHDLQLLRSKVSETMARRGLLIPHPREEYEMLEERLLEALELKEERITKCGHFRGRGSDTSTLSAGSDSGLGSSIEGSLDLELDMCQTCHSPVKGTRKSRPLRWSIRIYASNGLMRASAWAAAWSEMEAVDVEILPYIDDATRARLDQSREVEVAEELAREAEEEVRVCEQEDERLLAAPPGSEHDVLARGHEGSLDEPSMRCPESLAALSGSTIAKPNDPQPELPQVYRRSEVPLSVLLWNYILLLAKDRRNVAIFFLSLVALWFALLSRPAAARTNLDILPVTNASWTANESAAGIMMDKGVAAIHDVYETVTAGMTAVDDSVVESQEDRSTIDRDGFERNAEEALDLETTEK
ncbi:hypothetical protein LTR86_006308 [Recurvomyces mirabilis]|nr:hypothetical protein LTR86_006308 [Recurvomyces mirabilis]